MSSLLRIFLGLSMVVGVFFSAGAYTAPTGVEVRDLYPSHEAAFAQMAAPEPTRVIAPTWETSAVIDPAVGQDFNQFFGCQPPKRDSVCVFKRTGIDHLIPDSPNSAQDWRGLVELYFLPKHVDRAINIMQCESGGQPSAKNPRSTASGLFQHLHSLWPPRVAAAGWDQGSIWDPQTNVAVAAWLVYEGGGWSHWNESRHCWIS